MNLPHRLLFTFITSLAAAACAAPAGERVESQEERVTSDQQIAEGAADDSRKSPEADPPGPVPTFEEVKPILTSTCGGCHRPTMFSTVERVQLLRPEMIRRISSGLMPQDNPAWGASSDGKKVLDYLKRSPELG
jgi:hypothetical protein